MEHDFSQTRYYLHEFNPHDESTPQDQLPEGVIRKLLEINQEQNVITIATLFSK